jgi:hypothetical protein
MTEVALGNVTISGSTLVNGTQGNQGPQGMNGFQGTTGAQGNQGTTGLQGSQGNQGPTGLQGSQGNQGPTGLQGTNGTVGTQGNQGPTGLQGTQGNQGPTGLQGTQGNQGPTGLQGTQGNQGPTGFQGSIGAQGLTGASAGITGYTNPSDNRILTSVNSTTINAESNLIFDGTNLGIGTTSPDSKLHIISNASGGTNNYALILQNTTTVADARVGIAFLDNSNTGSNGSGATIQVSNNGVNGTGNLLFGTLLNGTNTERMRLTSEGKLYINTTSDLFPDISVRLHVGGTGIFSGDVLFPPSSQHIVGSTLVNTYVSLDFDTPYIRFVVGNNVRMYLSSSNVGIGTSTPTSNLSFDGSASRTVGMERVTTSNTAGNNLTISASSATVGATDKNGGDVIISGGVATGTGSSRVVFRTATANFSTGTGDRTPSDKVIITGNGTIIQNGVSSTFVTGTCTANQTVNISFTTVTGGRLRVHAIITPTDGTSIGAQKMSVIGNSTGGISEVVISNTTTATIGSWTFSGSGTFFGVTKNAGSAATACTYLIEVMGNLA